MTSISDNEMNIQIPVCNVRHLNGILKISLRRLLRESSPGCFGGRQVLSPPCHPCSHSSLLPFFCIILQAELEAEGLRSYKVPYNDNKKAVELLLNVSHVIFMASSCTGVTYDFRKSVKLIYRFNLLSR